MKNYICIEGKKAELTPEQLKLLGIEVKEKSPFNREEHHNKYYFIHETGSVFCHHEVNDACDSKLFNVANYCTDKALMEQRALHEILNRLLWRYSMEHDGDKIDWNDRLSNKFRFVYNNDADKFEVSNNQFNNHVGCVYFNTREIAQNAIKEIVEPFMKEHPEFKW